MILKEILEYFKSRGSYMVEELERMVNLESPSDNKEAIDRFTAYLYDRFQEEGATVELIPQERAGNHLRVEWGSGSRKILVLCHMDTVWPVGEVKSRPFRVESGRAYGPGIEDMKGGIVIGLYALKAIKDLNLPFDRKMTMLFNSDEEIGSDTSRELIESEAQDSDFVLVLEPAIPPSGALKTWRKGAGWFVVEVEGKASHAGADPSAGVSSIEEISHQVIKLHSLTESLPGVTVNVGVLQGGSRPNVVAAYSRAEVDVRVVTRDQGEKITQTILGLEAVNPAAKVKVSGGLTRPPMERTPEIVALFRKARDLAGEMGFDLLEEGTGGCSDGNFTAALGIPTLDGLGAMGDGGHSTDEYVSIEELSKRAAVLTGILINA